MLNLLELLAALTTAGGLYIVSEGFAILGFSIGAFSNLLWIIWAYKTNARFLLMLQIVLAIIAFNGILNNV